MHLIHYDMIQGEECGIPGVSRPMVWRERVANGLSASKRMHPRAMDLWEAPR